MSVNIGKMGRISCGKSMKIIYKSWDTLWKINIAIEAMAIEIVDLPIKIPLKKVFFHSYVMFVYQRICPWIAGIFHSESSSVL